MTFLNQQSSGGKTPQQQQREHLAKLQYVARANGLLDPGADSPTPPETLGAWQRVVDFLSRSNYAMVGAIDVLAGTGKPGESVGHRMARELISSEGDKERADDVFKQMGIGEGGRLSNLIGTHGWTKFFDPTVRGTAALAVDVFTDPTTYIGSGLLKGATKIVSKGGEVVAISAKGAKVLEKMRMSRVYAHAKELSIDRFGKTFHEVEELVLDLGTKGNMYESMGKAGKEAFSRHVIEREAEELTAGLATKLGIKTAPKVKFGAIGLFDRSRITGPLSGALKGTANKLDDILLQTTSTGRRFSGFAKEMGEDIDKLFNALNRNVRGTGYEVLRKRHHAEMQAAGSLAKRDAEMIMGRAAHKTNGPEWELFQKAIDNPTEYEGLWFEAAAKKGIPQEEATALISRWRNYADTMADTEIRAEALSSYAENYFPRVTKGLSRAQQEIWDASPRQFKGSTGVGKFSKQRVAESFDDMEVKLSKTLGISREEAKRFVNYNPTEVIEQRLTSHYQAMATAYFEQELLRMYAHGTNAPLAMVAKATMAGLREETLRVQPTRDQWKVLNKFLDKPSVKTFEKLGTSRELKSLAAVRMVSRVRNFKDVAEIFENRPLFDHLVDASGSEPMLRLWREATKVGQKLPDGFKPHTFDKGAFKGLHVNLPEGIVQDLKLWGDQFIKPKEVRGILKAVDLLTNTFKLTHTSLHPDFNGRNLIANIVTTSADIGLQAFNPVWHAKVLRILAGHDVTLTTATGRKFTGSQLRSIMNGLDLTVDHTALAEMTGNARTIFSLVGKESAATRGISKATQWGPRLIENEARAMHFLTNLNRGKSIDEAMALTKQYLFDYSMLSDFEKNVMRRIIPFYTWQSKNIRLQARLLATQPGYAATQGKLFGREHGPEADSLPSWVRGDTKIQLTHPENGSAWITGIDLPVGNIDLLWKGGLGATMRGAFSMITPLIKNPLEYAINMDTFTGQPVRARKWMTAMGPTLDRRLPDSIKNYLEFQKIPLKRGGDGYTMNGTKYFMITKALFMGRMVNTTVRAEDMITDFFGKEPGGAANMAKFLLGMEFREYDFTEQEWFEVRNKVDRFHELMGPLGLVTDFKKTYITDSAMQDARRAQQ